MSLLRSVILSLPIIILLFVAMQPVHSLSVCISTDKSYFDPYRGSLTISYGLGIMSKDISIKITAENGTIVKTWTGLEGSAGNHTVFWNGQSMNGSVVSDGKYFIGIESVPVNVEGPANAYPESCDTCVIVDTKAPLTNISIEGKIGGDGWYTNTILIYYYPEDPSGIERTYTRWYPILDDKQVDSIYPPYYPPYDIVEHTLIFGMWGIHNIDYYSSDMLGHQEAKKNITVKIDPFPPYVTYSLFGINDTSEEYSSDVWLSLSAVDRGFAYVNVTDYPFFFTNATSGVRSIEYNIDGNGWKPYSTALKIPFSSGKTVFISYRAIDNAGNTGYSPMNCVGVSQIKQYGSVDLSFSDHRSEMSLNDTSFLTPTVSPSPSPSPSISTTPTISPSTEIGEQKNNGSSACFTGALMPLFIIGMLFLTKDRKK